MWRDIFWLLNTVPNTDRSNTSQFLFFLFVFFNRVSLSAPSALLPWWMMRMKREAGTLLTSFSSQCVGPGMKHRHSEYTQGTRWKTDLEKDTWPTTVDYMFRHCQTWCHDSLLCTRARRISLIHEVPRMVNILIKCNAWVRVKFSRREQNSLGGTLPLLLSLWVLEDLTRLPPKR